jgi:hypothetical protein
LKGEKSEIEKLMAGWCVTTCWAILVIEERREAAREVLYLAK